MRNFAGSAYAISAAPSNMGGVTEGTPTNKAVSLRCVLVHAPGAEVPERLRKALDAKNIKITPTDSIYDALARLCRIASDKTVDLPILAFVEPSSVPHAADLAETASAYAPNAVLWVYASSPTEQIREVRESDLVQWRSEPGQGGERTETGGKAAGNTGPVSPGSAESVAQGHPEPKTGTHREAILTDEELEMLLADDPADPTSPNDQSD